MNAIRHIMKREGHTLNVLLPENFTPDQVEVIVLPYNEIDSKIEEQDLTAFRNKLSLIFDKYQVSTAGYNFDRDELYERG